PAFPAAPAASGEPAEPTGGSETEPSDPAATDPALSVPSASDPALAAGTEAGGTGAAVASSVSPAVATAAGGDISATADPAEGTAAAGRCCLGGGEGTRVGGVPKGSVSPCPCPASSVCPADAATDGGTGDATAGATAGSAVDATAGATAGSAVDATAAATLEIVVDATIGATAGATAVSLAAATAGMTPGATAAATAGSAAAGTAAQPLALVKRQAPLESFPGCVLYRYGTFATQLDIVQGIESVAIVQVEPEASGSSVELTVTCEGGVPEEVCTVVADAECRTVEAELCSPVSPAPGCEFVLRQDFNRSGLFCLNVSLANGNGLAVATARVAVGGAAPATGRTTLFVGLVLVAAALSTAAYTYR
ncbi:PMEL protein, partial [Mystacornis crossleyi]|nr:PMEL protein [Mystacornis crossleyi]